MVKNLPANAGDIGDVGSIPGLGRSLGGGNGNSLQYSCLGNPMDREAWRATVPRVANSQTQLGRHAHVSVCVCIYTSLYRKLSTEVHSPIGSTFRIEKVFGDCWGEKRTKNIEFSYLGLIIFKGSNF